MTEERKYRLGNQSGEYDLSERYLGWTLEGFANWRAFITDTYLLGSVKEPVSLTLVSPDGSEKVALLVHQSLSKDAFPLSFFGETRAENWHAFFLVSSTERPDEKFLIPAH